MDAKLTRECWRNPKSLTVLTSVCSCASIFFLIISMSTDFWLYSQDLQDFVNQTAFYQTTHSGLWKSCSIYSIKNSLKFCSYIAYWKPIDREGLLPTESLLPSMRKVIFFPSACMIALFIGEAANLSGHLRKRSSLIFMSGILFVIGGLLLLVGVIIYMGAVAEEASINRPKSTMDPPKFIYQYGTSFYMAITAFFMSQLTGIFSVYLSIVYFRHKSFIRRIQKCNNFNHVSPNCNNFSSINNYNCNRLPDTNVFKFNSHQENLITTKCDNNYIMPFTERCISSKQNLKDFTLKINLLSTYECILKSKTCLKIDNTKSKQITLV